MPIISPQIPGVQSVTELATTDANTFTVTETFLVGGPGLVVLTMTLTATHPDSEVFGTGVGQIGVAFIPQSSPDGATWSNATAITTNLNLDVNGNASSLNQFYTALYPTLSEGRGIASIVNSDGSPYAGVHHPTATVRFFYGVYTLGASLS